MRVAIVSESFLPTVNGVTNSVRKVLDHLAARGHEATVIAPAAPDAPSHYGEVRVHPVPAVAYRRFPVGLPNPQVRGIIEDFAPDVVHAASPFLLGAQAIASANRLDIPSIAVFQTDVAGYAQRHRLKGAAGIAWRMIRWIHEGADRTLAPSSASIADLETAGVPRLARWGRGVDLETYHPRRRTEPLAQRLRARLAPNGEVIIGYIGRIAAEKQVERLRVLRGMPGIRLVIVGDGPAERSVQRALRGIPTTWLGRLGGSELAAAYASLDVFVHTGTEETFGQTVQEAHASGLPVVAPRAGGPIDLVHHGHDGFLFDPADDRTLRDSLGALVADAGSRSRMGEAGRRRVLSRSWATIGDELLEHYSTVIDARRTSPVTTATSLAPPRQHLQYLQ